MPSATGRRSTRCRSGFATRAAAHAALQRAVEAERTGIYTDDELTVARYLTGWLTTKEKILKPTTYARYRDHVHGDLIPAFGRLKLCDLRFRHIAGWSEAELARGRGRTSVYRANATLSSALGHAARTQLLADNPARFAFMPRPVAPERLCWTPAQAAAFLRHNADAHADQLADLFELLLGTGMRRGEALGLHWADVRLDERMLFVRWNLTAIDNNRLHLGKPKTKTSRNWVSLSPRVAAALHRRADAARASIPDGAALAGLVFCQPDGSPLRPQSVLVALRRRAQGPEDFVTAVVAEFTPGRVTFVNCGHHPPLLLDGKIAWLAPAEADLPLGLGTAASPYSSDLAAGQRVLLYTDGLVEARDGAGRMFDLLGQVEELSAVVPSEAVLDELLKRLDAHAEGGVDDDVALVLCEPSEDTGTAISTRAETAPPK